MKQASFSAKKKKIKKLKCYCQTTCTCVHMIGDDIIDATTLGPFQPSKQAMNTTVEKSTVRQRGLPKATYG